MPELLRDPILGTLADAVDDIERTRIANENRLRSLTFDDEHLGHGLPDDDPIVQQVKAIVQGLNDIEDRTIKALERAMKRHPLADLLNETPGLGLKQTARLLASIGDPYWHAVEDRPRSVRELWAYCGFGVIDGQAPKKQKGQRVNWNPDARMRVWLIASGSIRFATSPYRKIYDDTRAKYADAVHEHVCVRCGPSGKPAQIGSPLSDGHKHARAIRRIAKEVLLDLWIEAMLEHKRAAKVAAA